MVDAARQARSVWSARDLPREIMLGAWTVAITDAPDGIVQPSWQGTGLSHGVNRRFLPGCASREAKAKAAPTRQDRGLKPGGIGWGFPARASVMDCASPLALFRGLTAAIRHRFAASQYGGERQFAATARRSLDHRGFCENSRSFYSDWARPCHPSRPVLGFPTLTYYDFQCVMLVVFVHVHVKPECVEAFRDASIENARQSVQEPGIARFDVLQQADAPNRFVLVEMYRTPEATAQHKETAHYQKWRDTVAPMMAEPRSSVKYSNAL